MAQHTINLPCIADAWVDNLNYTTNYGMSTTLKFGWYSMPSSTTVLKFDHSLIPSGKKLINATLKIYNLIARTPNAYCYIKYAVHAQAWVENVINWGNGNISSTYPKSKTFYSTLAANQYISVDITDLNDIASLLSNINGIALDCDRVSTVTNDNYMLIASRETANPPILQITYEDVPPDKPIPKYPDSQYIDNTTIIRFDWDYISSVGGGQQKFDLQYSSTNGATWTTITQVTANTYYELPANTLPSGTIMWRVQTYNEYNEASDHSDIYTFYSIGSPAVPSIYDVTTDKAKPTISWTASQQEVYQIKVYQDNLLVYDTGLQPNKEYSHKVAVFLPDDEYTIKVRVQNEYGLWSAWAERLANISTTKPTMPNISILRVRNGIQAEITNTVEAAYFLLLRNDLPIYKATSTPLFDYAAEHDKEYQYTVRAVSSNDTYIDSDSVTMSTKVLFNVFAQVGSLDNMLELKYNIYQRPDKKMVLSTVINTMYVSGREYAIAEKSQNREKSYGFTMYVKNAGSELARLAELEAESETVLYRDNRGKKLFGYITGLETTELRNGNQISFAINAVDYMEGVYGGSI